MTLTYAPRLSTRVWHQPADVLPDSPLPKLGRVHFDENCLEWLAHDSDGYLFFGDSPENVCGKFATELSAICQHARKSGIPLEQLCQDRSDDNNTPPERPY